MNRIAILSFILSGITALAGLSINGIFTSQMVLQQQKPIHFFGNDDPGKIVTVSFKHLQAQCQADDSGYWQVYFPAQSATNQPQTIMISDGTDAIELTDVLIGEVWLCSGQSNMEMPIGIGTSGWSVKDFSMEARDAEYPEIRIACQTKKYSHRFPLKNPIYDEQVCGGHSGWSKCTPEYAHNYPAVPFFFGRNLYKHLNVPIGLIIVTWRGSEIAPWISASAIYSAKHLEDLKSTYSQFLFTHQQEKAYEAEERQRYTSQMAQWHPLYVKANAEARKGAEKWKNVVCDETNWTPVEKASANYNYTTIWYRAAFILPPNAKGKSITITSLRLADAAEIYINGKLKQTIAAETPNNSQKCINITLSPEELNQERGNVIAIRAEYFGNQASLTSMRNIPKIIMKPENETAFRPVRWVQKTEFECTFADIENGTVTPNLVTIPYATNSFPANIYNGMVAPWTQFPIRGVIWYQGESDLGQASYYYRQKALIKDFRSKWRTPKMPFIITQLAGYAPQCKDKGESLDPNKPGNFAITREIQSNVMQEDSFVGLATAIDIGEAASIYPSNKQELARRLVLEARRIAYGENIVSRGPIFKEAKIRNNAIQVFFDNAENGLSSVDERAINGFAIAGKDKKYVWADATIKDNTVIVQSPAISEPLYVRYAFVPFRGDLTLQNTEGLPAYPFRTDPINDSDPPQQ